MIEGRGSSASGRSDRAMGWILLHAPAPPGNTPLPELFAQLGLVPNADRLSFAGHTFRWLDGAAALDAAKPFTAYAPRLIGIARPPLLAEGRTLAFAAADPATASAPLTMQALCALTALVAATTTNAAIGWTPARLWSSPTLFSDAVIALERQGLPPVMHLVGFDTATAPATSVTTDGLAWFCGHELRLTAPSGYPAREAIRRAARLAVDALVHRGLAEAMTVDGIEQGETLVIGTMAGNVVPVELRPPPD